MREARPPNLMRARACAAAVVLAVAALDYAQHASDDAGTGSGGAGEGG